MSENHKHCLPLDSLVRSRENVEGLQKAELHKGDLLYVSTRNSTYRIRVLSSNAYEVTGGWFDRKGLSPSRTTIAGCTWGGSTIIKSLAAANGLCIEFGNRLITTPVSRICLLRREQLN
jgi:hypothetical protein